MSTPSETLEETIARVRAFTDEVLSMESPRNVRLKVDFDALEQRLSLVPQTHPTASFVAMRA